MTLDGLRSIGPSNLPILWPITDFLHEYLSDPFVFFVQNDAHADRLRLEIAKYFVPKSAGNGFPRLSFLFLFIVHTHHDLGGCCDTAFVIPFRDQLVF